jgi:hypothetical protein
VRCGVARGGMLGCRLVWAWWVRSGVYFETHVFQQKTAVGRKIKEHRRPCTQMGHFLFGQSVSLKTARRPSPARLPGTGVLEFGLRLGGRGGEEARCNPARALAPEVQCLKILKPP